MKRDASNPCGRAWGEAEAEAINPWQITPAVKAQWQSFPDLMQRHYARHGRPAEEEAET